MLDLIVLQGPSGVIHVIDTEGEVDEEFDVPDFLPPAKKGVLTDTVDQEVPRRLQRHNNRMFVNPYRGRFLTLYGQHPAKPAKTHK